MNEKEQIKNILLRLGKLEKEAFPLKRPLAKTANPKLPQLTKLDFGLNEKHFIKTYAKGLSGPKKFTLLLACIAKGKVGTDIEVGVISNKWNKMKAKNLLGYAFNSKYPNEAVTYGWVDSKKHGFYHLRQGWIAIFG
jgi:hypothetical protein